MSTPKMEPAMVPKRQSTKENIIEMFIFIYPKKQII